MNQAKHTYQVTGAGCAFTPMHGNGDLVEKDGRFGLHFDSVHGRARIPAHTLAETRSTIVAWVLPMQGCFPLRRIPRMPSPIRFSADI